MFKKVLFSTLAVLMVAGMAVWAPVASADGGDTVDLVNVYDDDYGWVACIADGRINGCDVDAPVAIYEAYDTNALYDAYGNLEWADDGSPATETVKLGIELWAFVPGTEYLNQVLFISAEDIAAAVEASAGADTLIKEADGYSLNYSSTGYFWVGAPGGYGYIWGAGDWVS